MITDDIRAQLILLAETSRDKAYAPYSKFQVGAALLTSCGQYFCGCNVENGSYGLTICAERVAIGSAVAALGPDVKIRAMAVACRPLEDQSVCAPCGACRQVIGEF